MMGMFSRAHLMGEKMHDGTIQRAHLEEKWMMEMV
jgi:hypothetical protein